MDCRIDPAWSRVRIAPLRLIRRTVAAVLWASLALVVEVQAAAAAAATGKKQPPSEQSEYTAVLDTLDEATELATKSRLNVDYVPGLLTVLHREEMLALGARTVADALTLVPGVQINRRNTGRYTFSMRGLENSGADIKVHVDSVPLNSSIAGSATYFELPIAQVERIEVIRGPGSALYGEFAFAGVINIVTAREPQIHVRHGDHGTTQLGAVYRILDPERGLSLRLNLAGWDSAGADVTAGPDTLYAEGLAEFSNAPGPVHTGERYRFGLLALDLGDLSFLAQYQFNGKEPFFGISRMLADPAVRQGTYDLAEWLVQGRYELTASQDLSGALVLRWHQKSSDLDQRIRPSGVSVLPQSPILPDGLRLVQEITTRRIEAVASLDWEGWRNHRWRFEIQLGKDQVLDAWRAYNLDLFTLEPLPNMRRYTGDLAPIDPSAERVIQSAVLQDQWSIHPDVDLTLGARYDRYSDVGDSFSPRLAAVWRVNAKNVIKAQFASGFFPPSLLQRYTQTPLGLFDFPGDPQTVRTAEVGYIFRDKGRTLRASLYYSELDDVITLVNGIWVNRGEQRLQGIELEWDQRVGRDLRVVSNLSYADTLNHETDGPIPGAAKWLGNLSLFYRPRADLLLTGRWRYVGDRARGQDDIRADPLRGYNDLSFTFNWFDVATKGLTLRAGLTNLLGASIRSPAPPLTYEDDYPLTDERTVWVQLSYELR
ncbi:MAG: TonB-dependent receptor [Gammaproteobacteria bacterium]|jgi:iron complex outermembrane receptor protein|nr:TonB-dependent receptor [Gammaproteobacteria bacterium]